MVDNERSLWGDFSHYVPFAPARALIMDLSRVRYRHVDQGFPEPRRREVAAQARAFAPDSDSRSCRPTSAWCSSTRSTTSR